MDKIFIIAGEASGDLHGSHLVKALKRYQPSLQIQAYGGSKMEEEGATIVRDYQEFAFMGFYEVAKNASKVLRNLKETKKLIEDFKPDAIIFIDFPSFNIRIAKHIKAQLPSTKLYYYISPKVWAWKSGRVHILNKLMDEIFVIFPFEVDFYAKYGYDVTYVGNPLLDEIQQIPDLEKKKDLIAVLPGSRRQEIQKMLPVFAELASYMPDFKFEVSVMPQFSIDFYHAHAGRLAPNLTFSKRSTYEMLNEASLAVVTSGTATLETALFNTPQVVAYKTSWLSYFIGKKVIKINYISLVNIILDKMAITELIQHELTVNHLKAELEEMIRNPEQILSDYAALQKLLGKGGASENVARKILAG
ncbi:lipid-A-disaccharide synthase [Portibacter lacus]|uniref:Lipid-A-disaccharide synthase n=1 Tax=Portibacter lacus TaxID=1099794 RepID=A0AA37WF30_9BACT|nr:lipid-A-disaccharide synthase [Portibacter lacus]GLR19421.1 lipid-A-disaccharide synthase [Portibacter lacus]